MEFIAISIISIFVSWLYLSYAPMHEIHDALLVENMSNQKHKHEISTSVTTTTK